MRLDYPELSPAETIALMAVVYKTHGRRLREVMVPANTFDVLARELEAKVGHGTDHSPDWLMLMTPAGSVMAYQGGKWVESILAWDVSRWPLND